MTIGLGHYLTVAACLFTLGVFGIFINRKNVIVILMSIELILLAVNINLVAFSHFNGDLVGQVFALFVLTQGGPGHSTELPMLFAYNEAFKYGEFGYAAALGDAMVVVITALLCVYLWRRLKEATS